MAKPIKLVTTYKNPKTEKWYVYVWGNYTLAPHDTSWMGDKRLGEGCLVPAPDLIDEMYEVQRETEAMELMASLYAKQLADRMHDNLLVKEVF